MHTVHYQAASTALTSPWMAIDDPLVDIVIPCHNEAATLAQTATTLREFLASTAFAYRYVITIADSTSTDDTAAIASELAKEYSCIRVLQETIKGRGRALKTAWHSSRADIVVYMDEDLSTDLRHLPELIEPLVCGEAALAVGSRLAEGSNTTRSLKREVLSRGYVWLLKRLLGMEVSDAQCGFKAMRKDAAKRLLPEIRDDKWFFDTELVIKAQEMGWRIREVPVHWLEDKDSRVNIVQTVREDLAGVARVRQELGRKVQPSTLAFVGLLLVTSVLYLWNLSINDYANSYYSAAVQAASTNWKAFFFGSLDAGNYITVDKPPVAIWAMALSARLFGFSSWSMLLPNALAGVATVALVYASVRRLFDAKRALIAGIVMALTPVAALMFRFNNPDAMLTFLLAASGYTFIRALEQKRPLFWLAMTGALTGLAFNTKMLQGLILLPIMGLVYLVCARASWARRALHLAVAGVVATVSTFWWAIIVALVPESSRPYVGSSTGNSIWDLIFGYNGFGRLLGSGAGQGGMGGGPGGGMGGSMGGSMGSAFGGETGLLRMFNDGFGPNIAWFLPLAIVSAVTVLILLRQAPIYSKQRAAILLWGGWVVLHAAVFSITSGVIHPYYPIVMAPAIAMLAGVGMPSLITAYQRRNKLAWILPVMVLITGLVSVLLLGYGNTLPLVSWLVLIATLLSTVLLVINLAYEHEIIRRVAFVAGSVAMLAGPAAFTLTTLAVRHTGSIPTAGPQAAAMTGTNNESSAADASLVAYLLEHQGSATWIAAAASANESAAVQISSGQPVMALGGFNGGDAAITLAEFKQLVAAGKLKYYIASSGGRSMGGGPGGGSSEILSWVSANATIIDYGGSGNVTLYELTTE